MSLDALALDALGDHPRNGALYGVSLGPGDPGLLTLRAAALLQRLDVVATTRSERSAGIARGIVAPLVEPARLLELPSAMPRDGADILDGWRGRVVVQFSNQASPTRVPVSQRTRNTAGLML